MWPPARATGTEEQEPGWMLGFKSRAYSTYETPHCCLQCGLVCLLLILSSWRPLAFFNGGAGSVVTCVVRFNRYLLPPSLAVRAPVGCGVGVAFGRTRRARGRNAECLLTPASHSHGASCSLRGPLLSPRFGWERR